MRGVSADPVAGGQIKQPLGVGTIPISNDGEKPPGDVLTMTCKLVPVDAERSVWKKVEER